ncbi:MAG TPA: ABC transporter substrate-binding protein, partial [Nitrospira sp.]|nr:ABC transporter substrate-binding protein [Nitrospira sp.]
MIERRTILKGAAATAVVTMAQRSRRPLAQPAALMPVKSTFAAPVLTFAGLYIANKKGLWAKNGIGLDLELVQGGALAMVSLTNQAADFTSTASTDPMIAWDRGIKTTIIAAFTGALAMQFTARKDWLERTGIGPRSPLATKVKALTKARIGIPTVGGGPTQYAKYLAKMYGIDPDRDLKLFTVGFGPSRIAALRENQVDITVGDAPEADEVMLGGFGELFINCAKEVPIYQDFPYTVALVTPETAKQKPDVVHRIGTTLAQANDFIHTNFGETVDIMKSQFSKVDPRAIE